MSDFGGINYTKAMAGIAASNSALSGLQQNGEKVSALSQTSKNPEEALQQYEGLFLGQLMKMMFDSVPVDENFGGGFAEETYRSMLVDEYGMAISRMGGIGIADKLQKSLLDFKNIDNQAADIVNATNKYNKIYNL